MSENLELSLIKSDYMAEVIAETGTNELMDKDNRPYLGMYDKATKWFVPLRANVTKTRKDIAVWLTPFETDNPHFKNPGLDFMKAVYVPDIVNIQKMENTLEAEQWAYIENNSAAINDAFVRYVLWVDQLPNNDRDKKWSTLPLFPAGIENIKERVLAEEMALNERLDNNYEI